MENQLPHGNDICLMGEKVEQYPKCAVRWKSQIIKWFILFNHVYYILQLFIEHLTM